MSNINNILAKIEKADKLNEVKLAKHEIKLGITQDMQKIISELKGIPSELDSSNKFLISANKEYQDALKLYNASKDKAQTYIVKYKDAYDKTGILLNQVRQSATELGLSPKDIPNFDVLDNLHVALVKSYTTLKDTFSKQK